MRENCIAYNPPKKSKSCTRTTAHQKKKNNLAAETATSMNPRLDAMTNAEMLAAIHTNPGTPLKRYVTSIVIIDILFLHA